MYPVILHELEVQNGLRGTADVFEYPAKVRRFKIVGTWNACNVEVNIVDIGVSVGKITQDMNMACRTDNQQLFLFFHPCGMQGLEYR